VVPVHGPPPNRPPGHRAEDPAVGAGIRVVTADEEAVTHALDDPFDDEPLGRTGVDDHRDVPGANRTGDHDEQSIALVESGAHARPAHLEPVHASAGGCGGDGGRSRNH
jgi:hypothetical protein